MQNYTWPVHYPANCPHQPYTELPGEYYRMVYLSDKIRQRDFYSYSQRKKRMDLEPCLRCSISLYSKIEDAEKTLDQYPQLKDRFIVKLSLQGGHGVIHKTSDVGSHHDWWIPIDVDPVKFCCMPIMKGD